jgi:hypothetical protein
MTVEVRLRNDNKGHLNDIQRRTWKSEIQSTEFEAITRRRIWN